MHFYSVLLQYIVTVLSTVLQYTTLQNTTVRYYLDLLYTKGTKVHFFTLGNYTNVTTLKYNTLNFQDMKAWPL